MAEVEYIKYLWEKEGKSLREIAEILNMNFRTVKKYANKNDWNEEKREQEREKPVLKEYIEKIDEWLTDDLKIPRKQRHTAKRVYDRLTDECNFKGSYSGVAKYVSKKKMKLQQKKEGFLPLAQPQCHAQIDFGKIYYYDIAKKMKNAYELVITFPYSNAGFVQVFKGENQECLLEGMKRIFKHIGGCPHKIKADNMSTAVASILEGKSRVMTEGFMRFKLHYRFEVEFCNPAAGNEKGNVENKVGYKRRNFFVPVPIIKNFEKFNEKLLKLCEKDMEREHYKKAVTIKSLWEEEKSALLRLPENEYKVFKYESARIGPTGLVTIDKNKYAVTPELNGKSAQIKVWYDKVEVYYDHSLLKIYDRSYGENEEIYDWKQYLDVLCKKPGGVEHTRFFNQLPKLWQEYLKELTGKERKNALILLNEIVKENKIKEYDTPLEIAKLYGRSDVESVRQCYFGLTNYEFKPLPVSLNIKTPEVNYKPNLNFYDELLGGKGKCMN